MRALRDAHARQDARGIALLERAHATGYGALAAHPLRVQAEYWRLSALLAADRHDIDAVRRFLTAQDGTRQAERLRREWLKQLGRTANWSEFARQHPKFIGEDTEITCHAWQERLERQDRSVHGEAKALWNSGTGAPENCDAIFRVLVEGKVLRNEELWERQRKLLEQGNVAEVRRISAWLPAAVRLPERQLAAAVRDPGRYLLREKLDPRSRSSIELALLAIQRHARKDAADAAGWLATRGTALPDDVRRSAWAQVATQAAQQHEPRATEWFAQAEGTTLNTMQAGWRVRAALRMRNWPAVEAAINAMAPVDKREGVWRYWLGRALAEQGRRAEAESIWATLTRDSGYYYAFLAAEELGRLTPPAWETWQPQAGEVDAVRANPALQRALLLYQAGIAQDGLAEWHWALRGLDDRQLLAASMLAEEAGVLDRALNAAERTVAVHDFTRRFPLHFRDQLLPATQQQQLDLAWVYGLVRQESAFITEVRSGAGAVGLMQLMPTTAKWVAGKANMRHYHTTQLAHVDTNLALGTFYLRHVLDELTDPVLATAAYNAGPGRARRWRAEVPLEGAIYAETIPFNETRDYVKRVMANTWLYASRLGAPRKSLKEIMGTVPARDGSNNLAALNPLVSR